MTQEEKQLLLKDLCARLPYDVIIKLDSDNEHGEIILWKISDSRVNDLYQIEHCKPYLRPMSSMTEEEKNIYEYNRNSNVEVVKTALFDWLNEHHFDYRGLISMGLALEAPEGMYAIK